MANVASMKEGALNLRRVVLLLITMGAALLLASGVAHAATPANDNFANAKQISDANVTLTTGTNVDATKEDGEPNHANTPGGKSVWYYWTAKENGAATIDTSGSDVDTLLGVYSGSAVYSLSEVASNDDESLEVATSKVSFTATAGTTYRIAVDGYYGEPGNINLHITPPPDITAPRPPVIRTPDDNSYNTSGNITLRGTAEANSEVEIFEVTPSGRTSQDTTSVNSKGEWFKRLTGVPDGSHTYKAKATDAADNTSGFSKARTVIVDTVHPTVASVQPERDDSKEKTAGDKTLRNGGGGRPVGGIKPGTNVSARFSEAMRETSVKKAFELYKSGSDTAIRATVTYDSDNQRAVLDPTANLESGATYKAVVTTEATDLAGNQLDQDPTQTGNQRKEWFFKISSGGGSNS